MVVWTQMSFEQLADAKKTQQAKDWPMIELLVAIPHRENGATTRPEWIEFWLRQARTPELLAELVQRFPA